MRDLVAFALGNAVAIAALALAPAPSAGGVDADVVRKLFTRWLPIAETLAAALTLVLAARSASRRPLLVRHLAFWLAPLGLVLLARYANPPSDTILGAPLVLVVAGIAAQGVEWLWRTRRERSDRELGALLALTLLATSLALLPYERTRQRAEADEPHYLLMMRSLVVDRDLDLRNQYDEGQYRDFYYGADLPDRHVIDVGTHQYPIRDPGLPLLGTLPFALGGRDGVLALICVLVAAFAWRLFAFLRSVPISRDAALLTTGLVFVHPIFSYTTQIYPDVVALLLILVAADLLSRPPTATRIGAASALIGLLPVLSVRLWFPAIGLALALAWLVTRRRAWRLVPAAALPALALIGADIALDWTLFRIPLPNAGYWAIRDQQVVLAFTPQVGLTGLILDRAYGLLPRAPLYALAFAGAIPLWRRLRSGDVPYGAVALGLAWLVYLAYIANVRYWHADYSPSTRYQLATLSFALVAAAFGFEILLRTRRRPLAWIATAWSAAVAFGFALDPVLRHDAFLDMEGTDGSGKSWEALWRLTGLNPGLLFPSLFRGALEDWLLAIPWLLALAALVLVGARLRPSQDVSNAAYVIAHRRAIE